MSLRCQYKCLPSFCFKKVFFVWFFFFLSTTFLNGGMFRSFTNLHGSEYFYLQECFITEEINDDRNQDLLI